MELIKAFLVVYLNYIGELWFVLLLGFIFSGLFYYFIPEHAVERHLSAKGFRSVFLASMVGVVLPVCCIGALPIALTLRKKGASLGSVLAFLVATPATSISALVVCYKLLGLTFTVAIFISTVVLALIIGFVANDVNTTPPKGVESSDACCDPVSGEDIENLSFDKKLRGAMSYSFVTLPKEIGKEILLGIAVASFITVCEPLQAFIREYLTGLIGYLFILVFGLMDYVCSTASVPVADALIKSGMTFGQALCYLLVGPITSLATILVIKKQFGVNVLIIYLVVISLGSVMAGIIFDFLLM